MSSKTIILGNGLSALIWAAYHPDSVIIGPGKPGGMAKDMKAPFFLHKHPATKALLKRLGLNPCIQKVKVGYSYISSGGSYVFDRPPLGFRDSYYNHSRCLYGSELSIPTSVMNEDTSDFEAFTISRNALIDALTEYITSRGVIIINNMVHKMVLLDKVTIYLKETNITSDYNIISTLPMKVFQSLVSGGKPGYVKITPGDMLTKIFLEGPEQSPEVMKYNFIYFSPILDTSIQLKEIFISNITRMNNDKITGKTFFEYTFIDGDPRIERTLMKLRDIYDNDKISIYRGISVRNDIGIRSYNGIRLLGRGAQWDHSIKVQDVIMEAQKHAEQ